jgi:transcription elongation factor GreB
MGRWRPPVEQGTPYITAAGYRALENEARALWQRRQDVVRHLAAAAAEGDRSENAEYQYRKKQVREIDRRMGYLERRMPRLTVVSEIPADRARVFFGALIELEDSDGETCHYRIVGADETCPAEGVISIDSPVARQLLGRALDDVVELDAGTGSGTMHIVAIDYPDPRA